MKSFLDRTFSFWHSFEFMFTVRKLMFKVCELMFIAREHRFTVLEQKTYLSAVFIMRAIEIILYSLYKDSCLISSGF
jgi:hypothetical protein